MPDGYKVIWRPDSAPQRALLECPVFEVFYGGARGGGKTDGVLGEFVVHADQHKANAIGIMLRRTRVELVETIERSKQIYGPLGAQYHTQESMWRFPNGARLRFAYLERDQDADSYQGHSYTRVYVEEIGNFPSQAPIMKLMATLRSGAGVPVGFRATGNPGGPGHQWVKARYIDPAPLGWKIITSTFKTADGGTVTRDRVFIPSKLKDNRFLGPEYEANLHQSGSEQLVKAWLEGDWNVVAGAFFPEFGAAHILSARTLPKSWPRFRSGDWGSARPFSIGWWGISDGSLRDMPRGALVRYREWYGWNGKPNEGLKLTAEDVGKGIAERDDKGIINGASVLDPAAFSQDGGPSIAERIYLGSKKRVSFRRADNRRVGKLGSMAGWDQVRSRLKGVDGRPMIYFMDNCEHAIRTLPALQHDDLRPEDVDTEAEDHAPDECFVAGTMITTAGDNIPIESVRVGDRVSTTDGLSIVDAVFSVGKRPTFRVELSNGTELIGTANHPVWANDGYAALSSLRYGDMMRPCAIQTNTEASPGEYGANTTARSLSGITFITRIWTRLTTRSPISNASITSRIAAFTRRWLFRMKCSASDAAKRIALQPIGSLAFAQMPARQHGGALMASMTNQGNARAAAYSASTNTQASASVHALAPSRAATSGRNIQAIVANVGLSLSRETGAQSGARPFVVSVTPAGKRKVYNLTVSGPENYYANGGLVHNCRYACMSRPFLPSNQPKKDPVFPTLRIGGGPGSSITVDDIWKAHARARR